MVTFYLTTLLLNPLDQDSTVPLYRSGTFIRQEALDSEH